MDELGHEQKMEAHYKKLQKAAKRPLLTLKPAVRARPAFQTSLAVHYSPTHQWLGIVCRSREQTSLVTDALSDVTCEACKTMVDMIVYGSAPFDKNEAQRLAREAIGLDDA